MQIAGDHKNRKILGQSPWKPLFLLMIQWFSDRIILVHHRGKCGDLVQLREADVGLQDRCRRHYRDRVLPPATVDKHLRNQAAADSVFLFAIKRLLGNESANCIEWRATTTAKHPSGGKWHKIDTKWARVCPIARGPMSGGRGVKVRGMTYWTSECGSLHTGLDWHLRRIQGE